MPGPGHQRSQAGSWGWLRVSPGWVGTEGGCSTSPAGTETPGVPGPALSWRRQVFLCPRTGERCIWPCSNQVYASIRVTQIQIFSLETGNLASQLTPNLQVYFLRHSKWFFFFLGSITCKGQLPNCICWSAISKCADTGTDWRTASYRMLRDEGSSNTGSRFLSQRMCHLSFASTSISRDSSNREGTCEPVLPDNFFFYWVPW